jgi:hypothetical protein
MIEGAGFGEAFVYLTISRPAAICSQVIDQRQVHA